MIDLYLRFAGEIEMLDALRPLGMTVTDDEGTERATPGGHQFALWVVGEILGREGWHVNLRVIDPALDVSALLPYEVQPRNPVCVWA